MKKSIKIARIICAAMLTASVVFYASSCKKDSSSNQTSSATTVTEADAAELSTDAIVPANGGMVTQVNNSVSIYKTVALDCGVQKDSTITRSSIAGATPSYNFSLSWNYTLSCNGLVPNQLTFSFTGTGAYDGPRMSSNDKSTGGFVMTGFQNAASSYSLSSNYTRTGTAVSKIGKQNTFNSTITITSTNILVDKATLEIASGTASVTINATSTSGKTYAFTGTITFQGGKKANLVLNSGTSYTIQWS